MGAGGRNCRILNRQVTQGSAELLLAVAADGGGVAGGVLAGDMAAYVPELSVAGVAQLLVSVVAHKILRVLGFTDFGIFSGGVQTGEGQAFALTLLAASGGAICHCGNGHGGSQCRGQCKGNYTGNDSFHVFSSFYSALHIALLGKNPSHHGKIRNGRKTFPYFHSITKNTFIQEN